MSSNTEYLDITFKATQLSLVFLSEVEKQMDFNGIKKTDLAKMLGTSKAYLTQLWRGDKILNLHMISRMEQALNIKFNINTTTNA